MSRPLLDPGIRAIWQSEASNGHPPSFRDVAELEWDMAVDWWHEEAFLPCAQMLDPTSYKKNLIAIEASRGVGKSSLLQLLRLYLAEWVIPYLERPGGLSIRKENRALILFGRDEAHIKADILGPMANAIITRAPWLRTPGWEALVEDIDDPSPDGLRKLSEMKSKPAQRWESLRLDLANGVSIRTRTMRQSVRGLHAFYCDYDDPLTESNAHESSAILSLIQGSVLPAIEPGGLVVVCGCLTGDTDVLMADGTSKKISDVVVGEMVWAIDEKAKHGPRKVMASIPQRPQQVLRIATDISDIRATPNHPFLTVRRGGVLDWVRADNLVKGDLVVSARAMPGDNSAHPWMTEEMAWFLGFIMGDGWLSEGGAIGIAISKDDAANKRIEDAWRDCWPFIPFQTVPFGGKSGGGYIRGHHRQTVKYLQSVGLGGRAKTKRIPDWLFRLTPNVKIAFLRGLCDADGHRNLKCHDLEVIELANEPLIRDIRNLALTCGVKPGRISTRSRQIRLPSTGRTATSNTAKVSLNFGQATRQVFAGRAGIGPKRQRDAVVATKLIGTNFRLSRVKSITPGGIEQVYDLTVDGSRSFIANGLVVHNTPQLPGDLFDLIAADKSWRYSQYPAYDEGGLGYSEKNESHLGPAFHALSPKDRTCLWPARLPWLALEDDRGTTPEAEVKFLRERMLKRITDETSLVRPDDILAARDSNLSYQPRGLPSQDISGGCDPSGRKKDAAGFVCGYVRAKDAVRIPVHIGKLEVAPHLPSGEGELTVVQELNDLCNRFACYRWVVESNGAQAVFGPLARQMNQSIRPEPFLLSANKHTENGWLGLRAIFRNRLIRLPYMTEEDRRITDEFIFQLRGIQFIDGRIEEDRRRKNDLVSAMFLWLKSCEQSAAIYEATALHARHSNDTGAIAGKITLPGPPPIDPMSFLRGSPHRGGELDRPGNPQRRDPHSLQSIRERIMGRR